MPQPLPLAELFVWHATWSVRGQLDEW